MSVGYFSNTKRFTKVHVVTNGRPICGAQVGKGLSYQWCSNNNTRYVECQHCRKMIGVK